MIKRRREEKLASPLLCCTECVFSWISLFMAPQPEPSFLHTQWNPVIHYILVLFLKGATLSSPASIYRMDFHFYYYFFFNQLLHFVQQKKHMTYMGCIVYYVYIYSALCIKCKYFFNLFFTQAFVIVFDFRIFIPKIKPLWKVIMIIASIFRFCNDLMSLVVFPSINEWKHGW